MQKILEIDSQLPRKNRRLIQKLQTIWFYKILLSGTKIFFSPVKIFFTIWGKWFWKIKWIISLSTYKIFWKKVWYIDDFVINKKARWKWLWKKLMLNTMKKSESSQHDYLTLISKSNRKTSHQLYKKVWFSVISLWAFVFAYKKFKKKKK